MMLLVLLNAMGNLQSSKWKSPSKTVKTQVPCLTTCKTLTHPIQEKASYNTLRQFPVAIEEHKKSYGLKTDEFQLYVHVTSQKLLTTKWNTATDNAHLKDALSMSDVEAHCYLWDVWLGLLTPLM